MRRHRNISRCEDPNRDRDSHKLPPPPPPSILPPPKPPLVRPKPDMYDPDDPAPSPRRISLPFVEPHEFEDEARAVPGFVTRAFDRFWSGVTRHGHRA